MHIWIRISWTLAIVGSALMGLSLLYESYLALAIGGVLLTGSLILSQRG
jgi:hypothetical protein